jgi:hypothetical protein
MGQNALEVLFVLITTLVPIAKHLGNAMYGNPAWNTPNYQEFQDWNVKFVNFLTEHRHTPTQK